MTTNERRKLTLASQVPYEIKVPGELDMDWSDWAGSLTTKVEHDDDLPVTILTGTFDQAALHGFLRKLYSFGVPLISVILIKENRE